MDNGALLILPFLIFYINLNTRKLLKNLQKEGQIGIEQEIRRRCFSPSDLSKALRSVSTLDWEESLSVWGEPQIRHFTTGIDMAVWPLDSRISDSGAWPILIGLRPQDCEWSVAALKFEANQGGEWSVEKVEPNFYALKRDILDTIHDNTGEVHPSQPD